jgi:hypothetical protein
MWQLGAGMTDDRDTKKVAKAEDDTGKVEVHARWT